MDDLPLPTTMSDAESTSLPTPSSTGILTLCDEVLLQIIVHVPFSKKTWQDLKLVNHRFCAVMSTQALPERIVAAQYSMAKALWPPQRRLSNKQRLARVAEKHAIIHEWSQKMELVGKAPYQVFSLGLGLWTAIHEWKAGLIDTKTPRQQLDAQEKDRVGAFASQVLQKLSTEAVAVLRFVSFKMSQTLQANPKSDSGPFELDPLYETPIHANFEYTLLFGTPHEYRCILRGLSNPPTYPADKRAEGTVGSGGQTATETPFDDKISSMIILQAMTSHLSSIKGRAPRNLPDSVIVYATPVEQSHRPPMLPLILKLVDSAAGDCIRLNSHSHLAGDFMHRATSLAIVEKIDSSLDKIGAILRQASERAKEWSRTGETADRLMHIVQDCIDALER